MPSHGDNNRARPRRRQGLNGAIDHTLLEDMASENGKTLHTKDGQVLVNINKMSQALP